jgi:hypothetical protein
MREGRRKRAGRRRLVPHELDLAVKVLPHRGVQLVQRVPEHLDCHRDVPAVPRTPQRPRDGSGRHNSESALK